MRARSFKTAALAVTTVLVSLSMVGCGPSDKQIQAWVEKNRKSSSKRFRISNVNNKKKTSRSQKW